MQRGANTAEKRAHFYFTSPDRGFTVDVHDSLSASAYVAKSVSAIDLIFTVELPDGRTFTDAESGAAGDSVRFSVVAPFLDISPTPGKAYHEYPVQLKVEGVDGNGDRISDAREVTARVFREFFRIEAGMEWEFEYAYSQHLPAPPPNCGAMGEWREEEGTLMWTVTGVTELDRPGSLDYDVLERVSGVFSVNIPGGHCEGWSDGGFSAPAAFSYEKEMVFRFSQGMLIVQPDAPLRWGRNYLDGYYNWGEVDLPTESAHLTDSLVVSQYLGGPGDQGSSDWLLEEGIGPTRVHRYTSTSRGGTDRLITLTRFTSPFSKADGRR